ncbi:MULTISPECIES: hypothetical protein [Achromobacter]|uniref:Uncharacterized protein n=1 Tax=Achromobacter aegrifaciens TaxID=1287736 RepID=A0AAD2J4Q5_ACHAE|nr:MULTISPECIES: hypothetical protein [Achromobacter]CAB3921193.1 hypothetical protein LMG26684_05718 [Achromobacter mucicolens]CUJ70229.1 Uncharacterised protein [Achromobacter aegrifaciens]
MQISHIPFDIATNESTGEKCLLIPNREARGEPSDTRCIAGTLVWTAQDGRIEQIGGEHPLPSDFLDQFWANQQLLVIPIDDNGIPCRDFVVTPA